MKTVAKRSKGRSRTAATVGAHPAAAVSALAAVGYIESSALVAALLERDASALKSMRSKTTPITSALTFAEAARAIVREQAMGVTTGHDVALAAADRLIERLQKPKTRRRRVS